MIFRDGRPTYIHCFISSVLTGKTEEKDNLCQVLAKKFSHKNNWIFFVSEVTISIGDMRYSKRKKKGAVFLSFRFKSNNPKLQIQKFVTFLTLFDKLY